MIVNLNESLVKDVCDRQPLLVGDLTKVGFPGVESFGDPQLGERLDQAGLEACCEAEEEEGGGEEGGVSATNPRPTLAG